MSVPARTAAEAAWLEARRKLVTASDVAAIMGLERINKKTGLPYRTAADVWRAKVLGEEVEQNEAMEWGLRLQAAIVCAFGEKHDRSTKEWPANKLIVESNEHWFGCTPDAVWYDPAECPLEAKNVGEFSAREWGNGAPIYYQVQLAAQMCVLDAPRGAIAALIGGRRFVSFIIERDLAFEAVMLAKCRKFMDLVEARIAPGEWPK